VLIDSGASHNFISPKVTTALGLVITPISAKSIKLGDGHKVKTKGVCKGVKLMMGELEVSVDALVLELGGLDMVLGVAWLSTLGKVIMDWRALTMQFSFENKLVKLQGQGSNVVRQSYLNTYLEDSHNRTPLAEWWNYLHSMEANTASVHKDLSSLLNEFQQVFKDTIQLPPKRSQVHQIKLYPDHDAINVRPYRYPHHQKAEIERQVAELLQAGVIRQSMR
jgi:hypothetical protein